MVVVSSGLVCRSRMLLSATLALQCRLRQRIAYGVLRELRMKAKDVGNLKEENERLKQQILELRESAAKGAAEAGNEQVYSSSRSCFRANCEDFFPVRRNQRIRAKSGIYRVNVLI